jgi:hypothetical protein
VIPAFVLLQAPPPALSAVRGPSWQRVGVGITGNISGLAVEKTGTLLAVHDNKLPTEPRLSRIAAGVMTVLPWPAGAELPIDLEAITEVPGREDEFLVLASAGKAFHLRVAGESVQVLGTFTLPGAKPFLGNNYEGLRLQTVQGETVAAWTHRGGFDRDGLVFVAPFRIGGYRFEAGSVYKIRAPWPETDRRDASDVVIEPSGEVRVSAASDPGDDGPFSSTLYALGTLRKNAYGIWELPASPNRFVTPAELTGWRNTRKIEALVLTRTGLVAGTDDENGGGWLR